MDAAHVQEYEDETVEVAGELVEKRKEEEKKKKKKKEEAKEASAQHTKRKGRVPSGTDPGPGPPQSDWPEHESHGQAHSATSTKGSEVGRWPRRELPVS